MSCKKTAIPDALLERSQRLEEWRSANPPAGADLGGGGGDGTAAWTALHHEGAANGLHAVEEAVAGVPSDASTGAAGVSGAVGSTRNGADGICSGVGVRSRQDARGDERIGTGLG